MNEPRKIRYQVTRRRRQVQEMEVEAIDASSALNKAALNYREFRSILDSGDEWSYEVSPIQ